MGPYAAPISMMAMMTCMGGQAVGLDVYDKIKDHPRLRRFKPNTVRAVCEGTGALIGTSLAFAPVILATHIERKRAA